MQAALYQFSQSGAMRCAIDTRTHRHIVKDAAGGYDIRLLEDHTDMLTYLPCFHRPGVDVEAINQHRALHASIRYLLVHAIKAADEG